MSALANIVAFDGAATPVAHTLVPINVAEISGELSANWREALASVPLCAQISASVKQRRLKSGIYQNSLTVNVPVMESVSGVNSAGYTAAPKVAYTDTVVVTSYSHERSTIANRRLARQLALNIAGNISTSVAAVATGAVPELIDQNIVPS